MMLIYFGAKISPSIARYSILLNLTIDIQEDVLILLVKIT
jgi:hypothetical protein